MAKDNYYMTGTFRIHVHVGNFVQCTKMLTLSRGWKTANCC